ncbi:putative dihydroxy-acid dehydratase [Venturia nashicola]|nr:putative dihydroxy-acid dehydratase [Venturia nashicola]
MSNPRYQQPFRKARLTFKPLPPPLHACSQQASATTSSPPGTRRPTVPDFVEPPIDQELLDAMEFRALEFRLDRLLNPRTRRPTVPVFVEPPIDPQLLDDMELLAEEFRKERLLRTLLGVTGTRRPTVPTTSEHDIEPEIDPNHLRAMELRAEEFRKERLLRTLSGVTGTRRPTVPTTSEHDIEPEIDPNHLRAMELRAEEFRKERILRTLSGGTRTRRRTVPTTSEPDIEPEINPHRLRAMELRAEDFRRETLLRSHLSKCVHRLVGHLLRKGHVEEMYLDSLVSRCFTKLVDTFRRRQDQTAVELLEQQRFMFKALERQHANVVRHFIDHGETTQLPKVKRRHSPTLDPPTVTDMGNLGDVDTTSIAPPEQPQLDSPKQPVEEKSQVFELTSLSVVLARAGLVGFENLTNFLGNFANKARALIASFTGKPTVIEQQPQPRQPPVEEPSIVFGLTKERDPLYRSATPDPDASVLDGFLSTKHKQTGPVLLSSEEHHEYHPDPLYRSTTSDSDPSVLDGFLSTKHKQTGQVLLSSDEHHEYQPDPLYRSATPDSNASVLDGFLPTKRKQIGQVLIGSDEHHECQPPAKPGRPRSPTDSSVSIRSLDLPTLTVTRSRNTRFGRSTRTLRTQEVLLGSDEHHEYQPPAKPGRPRSPTDSSVSIRSLDLPTLTVTLRNTRFGRSTYTLRSQG